MSVEADLLELQRMPPLPPDGDNTLAVLPTLASLFAYIATAARSEGRDESDDVEVLARLAQLTPDEVREVERALRPLGYRDVCARLREISGRRQRDLRPLL